MNHSRNSVRKLTMLALLTAMSIVFARVLSISTGFVRFNLGSLPVLLARIPNALVLSAVNIVLLRILLENRSLMKLAKK